MVHASDSFLGVKPNEMPFSDFHCLSRMWNRGHQGKTWEGIDIRSCLRDTPLSGWGLSRIRLLESSHVVSIPSLAERAACWAIKVVYLLLFDMDKIVEKGGTSLILVPSGNILELEPYQVESLFLASWALSKAHSRWMAYTLSSSSCCSLGRYDPVIVHMGRHLTPIDSPVKNEKSSARCSSSFCNITSIQPRRGIHDLMP